MNYRSRLSTDRTDQTSHNQKTQAVRMLTQIRSRFSWMMARFLYSSRRGITTLLRITRLTRRIRSSKMERLNFGHKSSSPQTKIAVSTRILRSVSESQSLMMIGRTQISTLRLYPPTLSQGFTRSGTSTLSQNNTSPASN